MTQTPSDSDRFQSFAAFYPYYIHEHSNRTCRRIHVVGSALVIVAALLGLFVNGWWFAAMPVIGYGFAWSGISSSRRTARPPSSIRCGA